jgi:hypothetical protein
VLETCRELKRKINKYIEKCGASSWPLTRNTNIYYWLNTKPREEVSIFDLLSYVTNRADTFVMFKDRLELNK